VKNEVLNKKLLDLYSYVGLRNIILDIFKLFQYLESTNEKINIPRITRGYQVRYEQIMPISNSAIEDFILIKEISKIKNDYYRKRLFSKITVSLKKLNELELDVFHYAFYENKNEYDIAKVINWGHKKVRQVRKSACIKFLSSLGLDNQCLKKDVRIKVLA